LLLLRSRILSAVMNTQPTALDMQIPMTNSLIEI
jgi:hypothetical protein